MGLFVEQNSNRTKLQERLAAELSEKAKKRAEMETNAPDGIDDSAYIEGTKKTTSLAGVWIAIIVVAVGAALYFAFRFASGA